MASAENQTDDEGTSTSGFDPKAVNVGGESLADRILPHVKKILVTVIAVAVVISVILLVRWRKHVKQEQETARLTQVFDVSRALVSSPDSPPDPEAPKGPTYKTVKERASAALDAMAKSGAASPPVFKGGLLLDAGKFDEAIAEYKKGEAVVGLDGVLAREGLGLAYEARALAATDAAARQKGFEEALTAFTAMQPDDAGPRRAHALYHVGRMQLTLGKKAEAKASFEKAKSLAATSEPANPDPNINHFQLAQLIDRRLATM